MSHGVEQENCIARDQTSTTDDGNTSVAETAALEGTLDVMGFRETDTQRELDESSTELGGSSAVDGGSGEVRGLGVW